jgi:hypothetical protein
MKAEKEEFAYEILINKDIMSFRKKFYVPEDAEEFWEELIKDANEIHNKYNSTFVDQMIMVNVDDIERRWKITTGNPFINPDPLKTLYEKLRKE